VPFPKLTAPQQLHLCSNDLSGGHPQTLASAVRSLPVALTEIARARGISSAWGAKGPNEVIDALDELAGRSVFTWDE
jgi:hypothetical protein